MAAAKSRTFQATIVRDGAICFIPIPFDPKAVFGKLRAPVRVSLDGHTYRSTIAAMGGGPPCVPLRKSNREAAGLEGGETVSVTLALDTEERKVEPPADLQQALAGAPHARERWAALSHSHQREHVEAIEQAKKPETRARRVQTTLAAVLARPLKKNAQAPSAPRRKVKK